MYSTRCREAVIAAVTGPNNFKANLLVNVETHLPVMVSWRPAAPSRPGAARPGGAGAATPPNAAPAAPAEIRLYFADYRDEGGVMWPHRIRRAAGPDTTEETTFDRFKLNAKIDPRKFEVIK